jgi:putative photosynthetic complex assembly protein 2
MADWAYPAFCAVFVWWFSTGVIVVLDHLPQRTFGWSMLAATVLAGYAFQVLGGLGADMSEHGAYAGFMCALVIWAWQEMSFLMGFITGPYRRAVPYDSAGFTHFLRGAGAVIYHELAIVAGGAAICGLSLHAENKTALWTYMLLWLMRISAKLNLFAGVRNVSPRFLPVHLQYLSGFFRQRPMNALIPLSLTAGTVASTLLIQQAQSATTPYAQTSATLLATMAVLGTVEHWALIVPVPFESLWNWYLRVRTETKIVVPPTSIAGAQPDAKAS